MHHHSFRRRGTTRRMHENLIPLTVVAEFSEAANRHAILLLYSERSGDKCLINVCSKIYLVRPDKYTSCKKERTLS